jgi:hypothetical protein
MLVAVEQERVVGFAGRRRIGATNVVSDCFIDVEFQSQGIGTRLLGALLPAGEPVMTLASADPKAHALYRRFGMQPVAACPYLRAESSTSNVSVRETTTFPIPEVDVEHLVADLGARLVAVGKSSAAAITADSIETSVIGRDDDAASVIGALLAAIGGRVELQMSDQHLAYGAFAWEETDRDTLMATPGAEVPDFTRVTFNGDLLQFFH